MMGEREGTKWRRGKNKIRKQEKGKKERKIEKEEKKKRKREMEKRER